MSNYVAKPALRFGEALKLACGRLFDFNGRSRRSEFWWFMLAYAIVAMVLSSVLSMVLPLLWAEIASDVISFFALAATVRRLQDTGKSKWWVIGTFLLSVAGGIYTALNPAMEDLQSVNANPADALAIFTDPVNLVFMGVVGILELIVFVFTLLDSKPEANQYGESPKYVAD